MYFPSGEIVALLAVPIVVIRVIFIDWKDASGVSLVDLYSQTAMITKIMIEMTPINNVFFERVESTATSGILFEPSRSMVSDTRGSDAFIAGIEARLTFVDCFCNLRRSLPISDTA